MRKNRLRVVISILLSIIMLLSYVTGCNNKKMKGTEKVLIRVPKQMRHR